MRKVILNYIFFPIRCTTYSTGTQTGRMKIETSNEKATGGGRKSILSSLSSSQILRDLILNRVICSSLMPRRVRPRVMQLLGMKVRGATINPGCWFGTWNITIGEGSFVNYFSKFDGPTYVGKNCNIAYDAMICTSSHEMGKSGRRAGTATSKAVSIGDGVWIGTRAVVLPGVSIGNGCVIAAGAVVISDCEDDWLYAGVPAKKLRKLV